MPERQYLCIDQKSFVCHRGMRCSWPGSYDHQSGCAYPDRSENTICLAVSPSMKALGIKNRCRIKDIPGNIKHIVAKP